MILGKAGSILDKIKPILLQKCLVLKQKVIAFIPTKSSDPAHPQLKKPILIPCTVADLILL